MLSFIYTVAETPTQLTAVYKSNLSILVAWTYASNTQIIAEYRIHYKYAEKNVVRDASISGRGSNSYTIAGLTSKGVHNISIVIVTNLPSNVVGPIDPGIYVYV